MGSKVIVKAVCTEVLLWAGFKLKGNKIKAHTLSEQDSRTRHLSKKLYSNMTAIALVSDERHL